MNNLSDKNKLRLKAFEDRMLIKKPVRMVTNFEGMPNYVARKDNGDYVDDINNKK